MDCHKVRFRAVSHNSVRCLKILLKFFVNVYRCDPLARFPGNLPLFLHNRKEFCCLIGNCIKILLFLKASVTLKTSKTALLFGKFESTNISLLLLVRFQLVA